MWQNGVCSKYKWVSKTYYWCFSYLLPCASYSKINGLHNKYLLIVSMSQEFRRGLVQEFWVSVPTEIGIIWRFDWNQRICSQDGLTHMTVDKRPLFLTTWASAYGCLNVLIIRQLTFPRKWPKIKEYKIEATMLLVFCFFFFAAISTCHKFCFILFIRSITNSSPHSRESCLLKGGVPKVLIY